LEAALSLRSSETERRPVHARETRSIAYGDGSRRTLDVYLPAESAANAPVVVFFYGGSWQRGHKETYAFVGRALARWGYVALVPDYRTYPEVTYPGFIEDGAAAVAWAAENIAAYGGDPSTIFVAGHSAGAYIAAMLAVDAAWTAAHDADLHTHIAGLIGISGPYDFLPIRARQLRAIFGGPSVRETQPIAHVGVRPPPSLLVAGALDRVVHPGNSARMGARLAEAGGDVTLKRYPLAGHVFPVAAFAIPSLLSPIAPLRRDVRAFISRMRADRSRTADGTARR
jgi:acetyl esterase/lipase